MDKFAQKQIKKIIPVKNTWHDRLVNYIPKPLLKLKVVLKINIFKKF